LPINAGEKHADFLLTMRPPRCPFCLSLGPEFLVEVTSKAAIKQTYEPVVLSGRLAVLTDDPFGLFFTGLTTPSCRRRRNSPVGWVGGSRQAG
jgi:uncharacterized protein